MLLPIQKFASSLPLMHLFMLGKTLELITSTWEVADYILQNLNYRIEDLTLRKFDVVLIGFDWNTVG